MLAFIYVLYKFYLFFFLLMHVINPQLMICLNISYSAWVESLNSRILIEAILYIKNI